MSISILILTKNEQDNLPGCLESVKWADDIHVFDSASTDRTVEIAEKFGARVTQRGYGADTGIWGGDEAAHKNWGIRNIVFKYKWVLYIDADERVTPHLASAIQSAVRSPGPCVAFRIRRRDFFMGRWLRHVQASPFFIRLFQPANICYSGFVNSSVTVHGSVGEIAGYLDHDPFSKGISQWLERHNFYSTLEARQIIADRLDSKQYSLFRAFFDRDFNIRRFHQKKFFHRLPFRPILKFLALYILKGGFWDGRPGLVYAVLQSFYEYMIVLKVREVSWNTKRPSGQNRK